MDSETFREDIYFWIGFMLSSAAALENEPHDYGAIRLLTSTERMISILADHGIADEFMLDLMQQIRTENEGSVDPDRRRETLNRLLLKYSDEIAGKLS